MEGYKNMDTNTINILVGYLIGINLVSLIAVYIKGKTNIINIKNSVFNLICVLLSVAGGVIGVMLGAEMSSYEQDSKIFRKWIPFIIFIEVCIIISIVSQKVS